MTQQGELFGASDLRQPTPPRAPWPAPIPERIRPKLARMLADARYAQTMPWPPWELDSLTANFGAMADRLGPEESATWRAQWVAEIARLANAAAA